MPTKRPYTPAKTPARGKKPGTETFSRLSRRRWPLSNLGTWTVRDMRNKPGTMSQHAAAVALDLGNGVAVPEEIDGHARAQRAG